MTLPPAGCKRWTPARKAAVAAAMRNGQLTLPEAEERYGITGQEALDWQRHYARGGTRGLEATQIHEARREEKH